MEVREHAEQDAKMIFMFLQNQNTSIKEIKLAEVCNTNTYRLKKEIWKYENIEIKADKQ